MTSQPIRAQRFGRGQSGTNSAASTGTLVCLVIIPPFSINPMNDYIHDTPPVSYGGQGSLASQGVDGSAGISALDELADVVRHPRARCVRVYGYGMPSEIF